MIANRLRRDAQLIRDLFRRVSAREELEHLVLARSELVKVIPTCLKAGQDRDDSEDTGNTVVVAESDGADLDRNGSPGTRAEHRLVIRGSRAAEKLPRELEPRA